MANLEGGGNIIAGVNEGGGTNKHDPAGFSEEDSGTYKKDDVTECLNAHAEPHMNADVGVFSGGAKHFVVIRASEFENVPVVCKDSADTKNGRACARPRRESESVSVSSAEEFREITDRAAGKGIRGQVDRRESHGRGGRNPPAGEAQP